MILPPFSDFCSEKAENSSFFLVNSTVESIKNNLFAQIPSDLNLQGNFLKSDSFINQFAKYIPSLTILPIPWTQENFDFLMKKLTFQHFNNGQNDFYNKYYADGLQDVLIPKTVDKIIDQLFIFGEDSLTLQQLWRFSLALSQPEMFVEALIEIFRNEKHSFHVEWAQGLYDYFHPHIEQSKSGDSLNDGTDYQVLIIELFTAIILRYPKEEHAFQIFAYKLFTDFLCICRHSSGKLLVQTFRCFAELYTKLGAILHEDNLKKIMVEIVLTFTPNHQLFRQSYYLIQQNSIIYDDVKYVKLLIKLKVSLSIHTLEFIDTVLSSHTIISKPFIIMQYLLQICVTKQVWNLATASIIQKHSRLFVQSKKLSTWMKLFVRRTLQWVAIVAKLRRYKNRRFLIARSFSIFVQCTPEPIANEIRTGVSTLIQSGIYPELSFYFTPSSFDQTFLDEIEVIDVLPDLTEMLLWPHETLRADQLQKLENIRNQIQLDAHKDIESLKYLEDPTDKIIKKESSLETSVTCFYTLIVILIIIVVLIIIS